MMCEMSSTNTQTAVKSTDLPYPGRRQGKVRDVYPIPASEGQPPRLLIVASDRVSAFDVVLPDPMPGKGVLLTKISTGFFDFVRELNLIPDHLISTDPADLPGLSDEERSSLEGRIALDGRPKSCPLSVLSEGTLPAVAGRNTKSGTVCGIPLPASNFLIVFPSHCSRRPRKPTKVTTRTFHSRPPANWLAPI